MRELLFANPTFLKGLNLTVRNGTKWATLQPGEPVLVRAPDGPPITVVRAIAAQTVTPTGADREWIERALEFEHDPECRNLAGLYTGLNAAYNGSWGPDLTFVWFWVNL